jgi:hypothetical protein
MAKTTAPLLSFGGSGTVAKTMVYSTWKGIPYVRRHVVPANPQTTRQTEVRATFALLREMWKLAPVLVQAPWNAFAQGRPLTGMNKFVGENVRVLNEEADMLNFIGSPGAKGGLPPDAMVAAAGAGADELTATFTVPIAPVGWEIDAAVAMAFPDQPPNGIFFGPMVAAEDVSAPYVVTLTGLTAVGLHIVAGWLRWTKPDGTFAYSVGLTSSATPT